jgi:ADP-ribose pyrophosphatase YjhB (NUDIX family)
MSSKKCDNKSVGMLIKSGDKILLIERKKPPFGFAPPAGNVDDKGSFENAAREEVEEEVGLNPKETRLIAEGRKENPCRREGGTWHYWKIYRVEAEGEIKRSEDETKRAGWFTSDQVRGLAQKSERYLAGEIPEVEWQQSPGIEPVWLEWFKELKILP